MKAWQIQDAKAKFSQIIQDANDSGPQAVTRHGKLAAVVLGPGDYARLTAPGRLKMPDLEARFKKAMGKRSASAAFANRVTVENRGE